MIFRQKKIKKKRKKIYQVLKIIIFLVDFVPQSQHPSHIIPNYMCNPERKMSSRTCFGISSQFHKTAHSRLPYTVILLVVASSSCGGLLRRPSNRSHSTKTFTRIKTQRKTASNIKTASKSFCPKQKTNFLLAL